MNATEFAACLVSMEPRFVVVEDCFLLESDDTPSADSVRRSLESFFGGDRRRLERDANRMFVISGLLDAFDGATECSEPQLVTVAEMYAGWLERSLSRAFPSQRFAVEIVGREGVDDEPLELCVTFSLLVARCPGSAPTQ